MEKCKVNCFINNTSGTMDFINDWDCSGFLKVGAGNFKALFESIEREQAKRGTL